MVSISQCAHTHHVHAREDYVILYYKSTVYVVTLYKIVHTFVILSRHFLHHFKTVTYVSIKSIALLSHSLLQTSPYDSVHILNLFALCLVNQPCPPLPCITLASPSSAFVIFGPARISLKSSI